MNEHPRDSRITFDESTHTYYIDGSSENVISVTTLIHSYFPKFNADDVIKKMRIKGLPEKYKDMSDMDIKKSWNDNGKVSSSSGTKLHKSIESFYKENQEDHEKEFIYFLQFHDSIKDRLQPYRSEWSIFRNDLKLAGQLDMLYKVIDKDEYVLCDWKRSKEIKFENKFEKGLNGLKHLDHCNYNHYSIQLNIYKRILETLYDLKIVDMFLVVLHPDNDTYHIVQINEMKKEIDYIFKDRKKSIQL